jgi:hypothetical protein
MQGRDGIMTHKIMGESTISDGDRQRYIDWLKAEIPLIDSYHNHKETMAWAATAFYLTGVFGLAYSANRMGLHCAWQQIVFTAGLTIIGFIVLCFLRMQFTMRWKGADVAIGLRRAMARACDRTEPLLKKDLVLDFKHGKELEEHMGWPQFIRYEVDQEIKKSSPKRTCRNIALAVLPWMNLDPRLKSESPTYYAVILATVLSIAILWVDC